MRTTKKMQSLSRICGIRNFYGACCAFTLLILGASSAHSQDVLDKVGHDEIHYYEGCLITTPPRFTVDGKTSIQSVEHQGWIPTNAHLIDDELNEIKSIDIKQPDLKDITIIQKKGVKKVEENVSNVFLALRLRDRYEITEEDLEYLKDSLDSEKDVLDYFIRNGYDSVCIVGDRHYFYGHDYYDCYESNEFGFKYPKTYYYYSPAGADYPDSLVRLYRVNCRYERLGDYYIASEEETPLQSVKYLLFYDANVGEYFGEYILLTQTLFNDDEKYEYIRKTWEPVTTTQSYDDRMVVTTKHYCTGFEIVSEDGKILQTIKFGAKSKDTWNWCIINLNDKVYLRIRWSELDGESKEDWYRITPSSTSGLKRVNVPHGLTVMPTMAKRHETINVEVRESNQDRTVSIVGTGGQVVWQGTIHAGQKQLTVPASRLAKGVNVVNVDGSNGESVKVIVR